MSSTRSTEPTVPGAPRLSSPDGAAPPAPSSTEGPASAAPSFVPSVPALELPKGGGAIRGIGEKFSTNLAAGTGSLSVPIFTSPGRGGAGPSLGLSYSSGAGNGAFGLGWQLGLPSVSRRTDKAIPRYLEGEHSDTFLLADEEELVPFLEENDSGEWVPVRFVVGAYRVERFRPRIEASFTRIERWTHAATGEAHWRTLSRDNVRSIFGSRADTRVADPDNAARVFRWLLECTLDDRGNATVYQYKPEDDAGLDPADVFERNRRGTSHAQRYLKRVLYGNRAMASRPAGDAFPAVSAAPEDWLFEVVFDYGEHTDDSSPVAEHVPWTARPDAFSSFRAGFELRTRRLCRRVLMFHRIESTTSPELVRATVFEHAPDPVATRLVSVKQAGYVRAESGDYAAPLFTPAVTLGYTPYAPAVDAPLVPLDPESAGDLPMGIDGSTTRFVDLNLEGVAGMLSAQGSGWSYKRNLGEGHFARAAAIPTMPSVASFADPTQHLASLGGDGGLQWVTEGGGMAGFFERTADGGWAAFRPFQTTLTVPPGDPSARLIDLDGDGVADLLIADEEAFQWFHAKGRAGWESGGVLRKGADEEKGPRVVFEDGTESIVLADMTGDGLTDLVRIRNGSVCYWPNQGYGRFGAKVQMAQSPRFETPDQYRPDRLRLADVDGSGTTDVLYLGRHGVQLWVNQSGNRFAAPATFRGLSTLSDLQRADVLDLLGKGTGCLVVSSSLPGDRARALRYLDLLPEGKPYLLNHIDNSLGATIDLEYDTSTRYYLQDRCDGKTWATKLPFPVQVVARTITTDLVSGTQVVQRNAYHHGYYDRAEREFRGFARVESWDAETVAGPGETPDDHLPPVRTQTWFHTGAFVGREHLDAALAAEFYAEPAVAPTGMVRRPPVVLSSLLPTGSTPEEFREAVRALKGVTLRQEVYAEDGTADAAHPYAVTTNCSRVVLVQGAHGQKHAVVRVEPVETVSQHYERNPFDPRVGHELTLAVDEYGAVTRRASVGYSRRVPLDDGQRHVAVVVKEQDFLHKPDEADWYRLGLALEQRSYEVVLEDTASGRTALYTVDELATALSGLTEVAYERPYLDALEESPAVWTGRRLLARSRMWYAADAAPHASLAFGAAESLALPHHQHTLAATDGLLAHALGDAWPTNADATAQDAARAALMGEGGYVRDEGAWWAPSGTAQFDAARFYVPMAFESPFPAGHPRHGTTSVAWDAHTLHPVTETDAVGNTTTASYDPRTLAVQSTTDANLNRSRVAFDALGRVTATWVQGKAGAGEGDADALPGTRVTYQATLTPATSGAPLVLAYAHVSVRRDHNLPDADGAFEESRVYADGYGREAQTKVRCEPAPGTTAARWIGTGRTVYNNKGLPLRKYEPYFAATPDFETEDAMVMAGVSPEMTYDPMGRVTKTEQPDGTLTKVVLTPWRSERWDANDTLTTDSSWYVAQTSGPRATAETQRAAALSIAHANTPTVAHLDTLGRAHRTIADNGPRGQYATTVTRDIMGHTLVVTDARGLEVQADVVDQGGRVLRRTGMDTGVDRALPELAGQPMRTWSARGFMTDHAYDASGRPTTVTVTHEGATTVRECHVYGEARHGTESPDAALAANLRGRPWQVYDGAGRATVERYDFRGNPIVSTRRLATSYEGTPDWSTVAVAADQDARETAAAGLLSTEVFTSTSVFDARGRVTTAQPPRATTTAGGASLFATRAREVRSTYNLAGLLETVAVVLGSDTATPTPIVTAIDYDVKRRRASIAHGNGAATTHTYDPTTFRLAALVTKRGTATRQDLSYTYDATGNVVRIHDEAPDGVYYGGDFVDATSQYEYDAIGRLLTATGRELAALAQPVGERFARLSGVPHSNDLDAVRNYREAYDYDAVGNILVMDHRAVTSAGMSAAWERRYQYASDSNRLLATSVPADADGAYGAHYNHDAHGNVTWMPSISGSRAWSATDPGSIAWNDREEMASADKGGGCVSHFQYDAAGQRVRKVVLKAGAAHERLYLGGWELARTVAGDGSVTKAAETLHVMDGESRVAMVETRTTPTAAGGGPVERVRYQYGSHLGSVALELDADGEVMTYEEYLPYGQVAYSVKRDGSDDEPRRYRYTGMEQDETGLQYHSARYYAPWLGRWISPDPSGISDGVNLYLYVGASPIGRLDRDGRQQMDAGTLQRDAARRPPVAAPPAPTSRPAQPTNPASATTSPAAPGPRAPSPGSRESREEDTFPAINQGAWNTCFFSSVLGYIEIQRASGDPTRAAGADVALGRIQDLIHAYSAASPSQRPASDAMAEYLRTAVAANNPLFPNTDIGRTLSGGVAAAFMRAASPDVNGASQGTQERVLGQLRIQTLGGQVGAGQYGPLHAWGVTDMRGGDAALIILHYDDVSTRINGSQHAVLVGRFAGSTRWYYLDPQGQHYIAPTLADLRRMILSNDASVQTSNHSAFLGSAPQNVIMLRGFQSPARAH